MKRTCVAADEQTAPRHERAQFREIEFAKVYDARSQRTVQFRACPAHDPRRRVSIGWTGTQDDSTSGISGKPNDQPHKGVFGPPAERIPRADVDHDQFVLGRNALSGQSIGDRAVSGRVDRHLNAVEGGIRPRSAPAGNGFDQIPLIQNGMARSKITRAWHAPGIHPLATRDRITDPLRRPRRESQPTAARPAMHVDHCIEPSLPELCCEPKILENPRQTTRSVNNDDFIEMGIAGDDGRRVLFHEISKVCIRQRAPQGPDDGGRENDVTNQPEPDEKDSSSTARRWLHPAA
jgi:hypothetical protein